MFLKLLQKQAKLRKRSEVVYIPEKKSTFYITYYTP